MALSVALIGGAIGGAVVWTVTVMFASWVRHKLVTNRVRALLAECR